MKRLVITGTIVITLVLVLFGFMTAGAQSEAKGFAGEWQATYTTPIGEMICNYTFKVEGNNVTGKVIAEMSGNKSESEITDGKIEGDKIIFAWIYNNDVPMSCTGILSGDELKLTRQAGTYGTEGAIATRITGNNK
ncbi:MAG: hypothetical protein GX654_00515 [Desulfatiglans sp.]|jgi:hypothetical protein|nr:hypothetical protein [Desulfatiglans sp.]